MVQWRRRLDDTQEIGSSILPGITSTTWSVSVSAAHRCGKAEDRVQFPDGPLTKRAARLMVGRLACTQVIGVRLPGGPLMGSWSNGKTPLWHGGNRGSTPRDSTDIRKVAGYGLPGRFAKPCDLRVMWVQIPCLPLTTADHASHGARAVPSPMVKRTSSLASNEVFQVRVLVGVLRK